MSKRKDWDILVDCENNAIFNNERIKLTNKTKKRIPIFIRIIISAFIYGIIYSILNFSFPNLANYINQIACFVLAILSFILTSYKDYKNKLYNEIYKRRN